MVEQSAAQEIAPGEMSLTEFAVRVIWDWEGARNQTSARTYEDLPRGKVRSF